MKKNRFWEKLSRLILQNRVLVLASVVVVTILLSTQWKYNRFSFTEVKLLPDHHPTNILYNNFKEQFGDEANLMVIGIEDSILFKPKVLAAWDKLNNNLLEAKEISLLISTTNFKQLVKNEDTQSFEIKSVEENSNSIDSLKVESVKNKLYSTPFYENIIYNDTKTSVRTLVFIDNNILNTNIRKKFVLGHFKEWIAQFEKETGVTLRVSGMPYVRTVNTENIISEIGIFIGMALFITSLIFFLFFRSFRATLISMVVVSIGVMWGFGLLGLFRYEITILTALVPPLVIVIGIPNCIFLINKYQQEIKKHGNRAKSLQRVISKIGNATFLTNLTTAAGFATFIITDSEIIKQFGVIASLNIMILFALSLCIIPPVYSFLETPRKKHLAHLNRKWTLKTIRWMSYIVRYKRVSVYSISIILLVFSIIGIYRIKASASLLDDIPQNAQFAKDIIYFEREFGGIMPLEIVVNTHKKNGFLRLSNLERVEKLQGRMKDVLKLPQSFSAVRVAKYFKQAYYNGNPEYYLLPTRQEGTFILSYVKDLGNKKSDLLQNFTDSLGQVARITTYLSNKDTNRLDTIEKGIMLEAEQLFPKERYDVNVTGKALNFFKGTRFLVDNLLVSLTLAIILISVLMAYMFRSFRMVIISLIPNLLPLLVTAGIMGFVGIPLKPSTILVFAIALGISIDDTLHFLAKYRQELKQNKWKINYSVFAALKETGISMFYTSTVLYFGFSIFMLSDFGGTKALGGLVSTTLIFAMLSNLILLPSLLLSLEKIISNKRTIKKPTINILSGKDNN